MREGMFYLLSRWIMDQGRPGFRCCACRAGAAWLYNRATNRPPPPPPPPRAVLGDRRASCALYSISCTISRSR